MIIQFHLSEAEKKALGTEQEVFDEVDALSLVQSISHALDLSRERQQDVIGANEDGLVGQHLQEYKNTIATHAVLTDMANTLGRVAGLDGTVEPPSPTQFR